VVSVLAASSAFGHWDPGDNALFALLPDLSSNGADVYAGLNQLGGFNVFIADDFSVGSNTKMTDFHLWGSWLNDVYPFGGAGNILFYIGVFGEFQI